MKTRPGSMDWHNASTLPINWRDASPPRPIPNWRSKPSAVAPVDDIDWVNGNLVGYRRTVKKLIRGPVPYSGARIPLFGKNNSLFRQKNSLFHLLGNFAASICICSLIMSENCRKRPKFEKFPVKFPDSREFAPETGSPLTGSSAMHLSDMTVYFQFPRSPE